LDVSSDEIFDIRKKVKEEITECLHHDGNLLNKFKNYFKNKSIQSKEDPEDHSLYRLMNKINNPLIMMEVIYNLMDKLIQYIKTLLTKEEIELDSGTYLISRPDILQRRKASDANYSDIKLKKSTSKEKIKSKTCENENKSKGRSEWENLFDKR
jgi:hypothetical protein